MGGVCEGDRPEGRVLHPAVHSSVQQIFTGKLCQTHSGFVPIHSLIWQNLNKHGNGTDGFTTFFHVLSTRLGMRDQQDTCLCVPGTSQLGAGQAKDFVGGSAGEHWFQSWTQICMW